MTIPKHVVRAWKLEHGTRLVVQSTDQGILIFPRFFASLIQRRDEGDVRVRQPDREVDLL